MKKTNNKGFSLFELIIVIAIMAILIGVLAPQYIKYVEKSRESADRDLLDSVYKACSVAASDPEVTDAPDAPATGTSTVTIGDASTPQFNDAVYATLGVTALSQVQDKLKSKKAGGSGATINVEIDANGNYVVYVGTKNDADNGITVPDTASTQSGN